MLPSWLSDVAKILLTTAVIPIQRSKAARLANSKPVRLHLGAGQIRIDGWTDIDLLRPGWPQDLYWDLRRGIPTPTGSVDAIFSEHLLEHLTYQEGVRLLRECRRVLVRGGVLRVGVPDLDRYVASYLGQDDMIERVRPGRPTRAIALGEVFFLHGHRCMYDFETLQRACREVGFDAIERSAWGTGQIVPSPDSSSRRDETLYIEAMAGTPYEGVREGAD